MSKTVVSSDNAPAAIGPYSPGIQTGNMVFLSGQLGIDPATGKMPEGVEAQAKQSLANVEALLTAAGATFADVVKTTVYLADIADFAAGRRRSLRRWQQLNMTCKKTLQCELQGLLSSDATKMIRFPPSPRDNV